MNGRFEKIPPEQRFYDRIKETDKGCWRWQRALDKDGYGRSSLGGKSVQAHRVSWVIHKGKIPEGFQVLHNCDNPPCVNPDHLFLGSGKDNMIDKVIKQRQTRGDKVNTSKIKEADVYTIRKML